MNIGHNSDGIKARLTQMWSGLIDRCNELMTVARDVPADFDDEDTARKVQDLIKLLKAAAKEADLTRKAENEPYAAAKAQVDAFFNIPRDQLTATVTEIERRLTRYLQRKAQREEMARRERAEAERKAAEERLRAALEAEERAKAAERQAEKARLAAEQAKAANDKAAEAQAELRRKLEEASARDAERTAQLELAESQKAERAAANFERAASARAADLSRTRGDLGSVASLRTDWVHDGYDRDTIDLEALRQHLPSDAIDSAIRAFIKAGGRQLRGTVIFETTKAVVR